MEWCVTFHAITHINCYLEFPLETFNIKKCLSFIGVSHCTYEVGSNNNDKQLYNTGNFVQQQFQKQEPMFQAFGGFFVLFYLLTFEMLVFLWIVISTDLIISFLLLSMCLFNT